MKRNRKTVNQPREASLYLPQLLADGIANGEDLDLPAVGQEPLPIQITQTGGGVIRRTSSGNPIYEIPVRIIAAGQIRITDYSFATSFDPQTIELPFLRERREYYRFAGRQYRARDIVNDYFDGTAALKRNAVLEGVILAYGCEDVPPEIASETIGLQLTIEDVLGRECEANLLLRVLDQRPAGNPELATDQLPAEDKAAEKKQESPGEEHPPVDGSGGL